MSNKHTSEPWKFNDEIGTGAKHSMITSENGETPCAEGLAIIPHDDYWDAEEVRANAKRIVLCVNEFAGVKDPKELMHQAYYQLNQVLKEFSKYGTIGDYRVERVRQALSLFSKEAVKETNGRT